MRKRKTILFKLSTNMSLILNKHCVKFKSNGGDWEMAFGGDTREYAQILYLIQNKEITSLQNLSSFLYLTKLIVSNADFCGRYNELLNAFMANNETLKEVSEKQDEAILAEERVIHEKDVESILNVKEGNNDE